MYSPKKLAAYALATIYGTDAFDPSLLKDLDIDSLMKSLPPDTLKRAQDMMSNPAAMAKMQEAMKDPSKMKGMADMAAKMLGKDGVEKMRESVGKMSPEARAKLAKAGEQMQGKAVNASSEDAADDVEAPFKVIEEPKEEESENKVEAPEPVKEEEPEIKVPETPKKKAKKNRKAKKAAMPDLKGLMDGLDPKMMENMMKGMGGKDGINKMMESMGGKDGINKMMEGMGGMDGINKMMEGMGGMDGISKMMKGMGGMDGIQDMMKNLGGMEGLGDMMKGMGDLKDMPNTMAELSKGKASSSDDQEGHFEL